MFPSRTLPRSALPLPVVLLPLAIFMFVLAAGGMTARAMLRDRLPPLKLSAAEPAARPIAPLFTPEVQYWGEKIAAWAALYQLDPNLVATVMQIESCGNPEAVSPSSAQGLFQVMPYHFADGEAMRDPDTNAKRGLDYLARGLALADGKSGLALAGYNGGHSVITAPWSNWPAETQRYYYWGSGIYHETTAGGESSPTLDEWLSAGGASLCAKARRQLGLP